MQYWPQVTLRCEPYSVAAVSYTHLDVYKRQVVNNHAPVISGTDSNLGTKTAAFAQSYSVTDEDSGQTLSLIHI